MVQEKSTFWMNHVSDDIVITPSEETQYEIYDDCGKAKSCFGLPGACIKSRNCESFGAVIVKNGTYMFEMQSPSKISKAFALSREIFNAKMTFRWSWLHRFGFIRRCKNGSRFSD